MDAKRPAARSSSKGEVHRSSIWASIRFLARLACTTMGWKPLSSSPEVKKTTHHSSSIAPSKDRQADKSTSSAPIMAKMPWSTRSCPFPLPVTSIPARLGDKSPRSLLKNISLSFSGSKINISELFRIGTAPHAHPMLWDILLAQK